MNKIAEFIKKYLKLQKYTNIVDAARSSKLIRKLTGSAVLEVVITPGNRAETRFSALGFFFYIFWNSLYIYCAYASHSQDQTILRNLYQTKLRRYGDDFERISSFIYVMFTMWLIPFRQSGSSHMLQIIIDLDKLIQENGDNLDYNKIARETIILSVGQLFVYLFRMLCIWFPIHNANLNMPMEKMFQVAYSDAQAIILTSIFCYFLIMLRDRFKWINRVLKEIKLRDSWEFKVFTRGKLTPNLLKVVQIQEKHICEKIKICARVYSMLFNVCELVNRVFGFALLITLFHYLNYIILYLFYFMEATASGLFHDLERYVDFVVYGFWEIAIAIGIIFLIVYFCETAMKEAKSTSYMVHDIINDNFSAEINSEAMQLSVQLLHEKPAFNVLGLFDLNYALLQQGARSVSTYLVILLQFATGDGQGAPTI